MKIKKEKTIKPEKKVMIIKKVVSKSLKKAKETVNRAKKPAEKASSPSKQSVQKVKKLPVKNMRPRRQPIKVFRTRYRIKEMHRRIEENRSSDFFDFFYGLGLIPINRDGDGTNSLYIPFIPGSPKMYDNTKYLCNKESSLRSSTSDLSNCQPSPHAQLPSKYPIWTPVRTSTIHDPCSSQSGNPWRTSPRVREEHIITDRFTQSKSPEDAVFTEKFHKASLKSEAALSPGESPITPEQLAVVRKLFPPIGSLTFPSQRRAPDSQVTFNEPLKASERSLRPRTSEQTQRLSHCFRKRHYQKRKRTLSEPSRSPERRPNGPSVSDIDWLSADGFPSSAKKSCPGGSSPVYSFGETRHCFRKEHFEDSACPPHMPTSGICGNSPRTAVCSPSNDRPASFLYDSAKHVGRAMPTSPKATSSSEGKDLFFGQANRLATLRKKQDRNEPVMHTAKGHLD
uniref:Phosphatase binding protein n=1 Tax=Rhipicephalus appendiculatus TaxID=34631 RepID=A0A131YUW4_RHIAP